MDDLKGRIATLEGRMKTDKNLGGLLDTLSGWKVELAQLEKALESEKHPTDAGTTLAEAQGIIDLIATDPEHYRTKLKQLLHLLISEMHLMVFDYETKGSRGRTMTARAAILQVHFRAGHACWYTIARKPDKTPVATRFDPPRLYKDLRKPSDAEQMALERGRLLAACHQLEADIEKYGRPRPDLYDREREEQE